MKITPYGAVLGATVEDIDLRVVETATFESLRAALARHLVLFVGGQDLGPADLAGFVGRFGPLFHHPEIAGIPGHPAVMELRKEPDDPALFGGGDWHADVTYRKPAATVSALHALEVPEVGGDTCFANQVTAFAGFSPGLRARLRTLTAVHSYHGMGGAEEPALTACHPVVRRHPETGAEALYLNRMFAVRFDGMTAAESRPLIEFLTAAAVRPEHVCRWRWRAGDLVLWDNRMTLHYPLNDLGGRRRVMIRASALEA